MMQENDLRTAVKRCLGPRFHEDLWDLLVDLGFVDEVLVVGAMDLDQLVARARKILAVGAPALERRERVGAPARPEGPTPGQERAWALSELVAHHAREDQDVIAFRRSYLEDTLVEWADLDTWIKARAERDGERTRDLTVELPAGTTLDRDGGELRISPPLKRVHASRVAVRTLAYALPEDEWVRRVGVTAGGTLDRLRALADALANSYGWMPVQASIFVMCGVTPLISTVRATAAEVKVRHEVDLAWARRITLDIDPAATPQEVLDAFQRVRHRQGLARLRPLTVKHLRLAPFAGAEHADKPWAERLRLWNSSFPDWHYAEQSNFRRDAIRAQARILCPGRHRGSAPLRERPPAAGRSTAVEQR